MEKKDNVIIYIDAANLILGIRNFLNIEIDMFQLLLYLKEKYRASKCVYFTANIEDLKYKYEELKSYGVEIVYKEMYFENGKNKANCDVEISNRITIDVENKLVDKIIFISGDGDFVSLLNYVKKNNIKVILYGPHRRCTSKMLRNNNNFNLSYISQLKSIIEKRKGLAGHLASERLLFVKDSITTSKNLSNEFFRRLNKLNLDKQDFIVLGSGILQVKGIRKSGDIDLLVKKELFEELKKDPTWKLVMKNTIKAEGIPQREYLVRENEDGKVELRKEFWIAYHDTDFGNNFDFYSKFINTEQINGVTFTSLKTMLMVKLYQAREKDLNDVELIKQYLEKYDN